MNSTQQLLIKQMNVWTTANVEKKSGRGRSSDASSSIYGISKLRALILQLAIRGKLLEQSPADEPASELLNQISQYVNESISHGLVRKQKSYDKVAENERTFFLPNGWEWIRLGQLGDWGAGATPLRSISAYYGGGIPWFKSGELSDDLISVSEETVSKLAMEECSLRMNRAGDVLLAMYGATIGKASILDVNGTTNQAVCACSPYPGISNKYLLLLLKAMRSNFISQGTGGAQPNISREKIIETPVALPPQNEQVRILEKVDELMKLCDQIEKSSMALSASYEVLVKSFLHDLIKSSRNNLLEKGFNQLFNAEFGIRALKKVILELGISGRLTCSDSDNGNSKSLYNEMRSERVLLISKGTLKEKDQFIEFDGLESLKMPISSGWCWVRLGEIAEVVRGGSPRPAGDPRFYDGSIPFLKVGDVTRSSGKMVEGWTSSIKEAGLHKTRLVKGRTVLLTNSGATLGVSAICDFETTFNDGIAAFINLSKFVSDEYLHLYLTHLSDWFLNIAAQGQGQPNLNIDIIRATWMPMPPIEEQLEIVSKVDELLEMCSALQDQNSKAGELQRKIADTLVSQALA